MCSSRRSAACPHGLVLPAACPRGLLSLAMNAVVPETPDLDAAMDVEKPAVDAGHNYGGATAGCRGRPRALLAKLEARLLGALAAGGRAPRVRRTPAAGGPAPRRPRSCWSSFSGMSHGNSGARDADK